MRKKFINVLEKKEYTPKDEKIYSLRKKIESLGLQVSSIYNEGDSYSVFIGHTKLDEKELKGLMAIDNFLSINYRYNTPGFQIFYSVFKDEAPPSSGDEFGG